MPNPLCPFCGKDTTRISDNQMYEAWGCEEDGVYINRRKPRAPLHNLTPISAISTGTPAPLVAEATDEK